MPPGAESRAPYRSRRALSARNYDGFCYIAVPHRVPAALTLLAQLPYGMLRTMKSSSGVRIRSNIRGGRLAVNHNAKKLVVKSSVKSGRLAVNHSAVRVRSTG